jgi:hypothetical protein
MNQAEATSRDKIKTANPYPERAGTSVGLEPVAKSRISSPIESHDALASFLQTRS